MASRSRLAFALAPAAAAVIGGVGSRNAPQVYARLRKPAWAPPAGAFGPVWTALYAAIGVAGWRAYPRMSTRTRALHAAQLTLNAAWPWAFFAARGKPTALAIIAALDATLAAEIVALRDEDPTAAALLAPYLAWCGYATALNAAVSAPQAE
ncbi:MAG: TspO/MBR family protein [Jatrophihabitans sp.]|uniref:TspO/MBR family protein n=1 Tax=Jatrophihabitans sp. TaxID=1932789 RepID=UPI003F81870A